MTIGTRPSDAMTSPAPSDTLWTLPTSETGDWEESPAILPPGIEDSERYSRRAANHSVFKMNGNKNDWLHYVHFGYYLYDDVQNFVIEWRDAKKNKLLLSHFIWNTYHQYRMNFLPMTSELTQWAITHVKPFLQTHDPDVILATSLDFENSCTPDTNNQRLEEREDVWTEIGKHGKKNSAPQILPTTPHSPTRSNINRNKEQSQTETYYSPIQIDDPDDDDVPPSSQAFPSHNSEDTNMSDEVSNTPTSNTRPTVQIAFTPLTHNKNPSKTALPIRNPYAPKVGKKAAGTFSYKKRVSMSPPTLPSELTPNRNTQPVPTNKPENVQRSSLPMRIPNTPLNTHQSPHHDDATKLSSQSTFQTSNPHIPINDGTQRLTIRWKPANFEQLTLDTNLWDTEAANMVHNLFHIFSEKINAVIWEEKQIDFTRIDSLTPANIRQYLSPKISELQTTQTFIFGLRLSAGANTVGNWLNNEHTKTKMGTLAIETTISNAKCTSGNVVPAGCILFKHPIYTHRLYYLLSLRKILPDHTPFFDLGIHRRTSNGDEVPHLVIKCGENHVQGLSDILASTLDGKNTSAVFIPQPALKSMTEEEMKVTFAAHHGVVTKMQRLSLHPRVVNIDRTRSEKHFEEAPRNRSTREWANSLCTPSGQHMRCDAENGGTDRRAYLLVPEEHVELAKEELHKYLHALKMGIHANTHNRDSSSTFDDTPRAIYIPSQAVRANLDFIKNLTSVEIWKNAPASVRNTPLENSTTRPHHQPQPSRHQYKAQSTPAADCAAQTCGPGADTPPQIPEHPKAQTRPDDATIGTSESTASRTASFFSTQTSRFQELEAQIKLNHQAYAKANLQIDTIQEQVMKTMEACAASSQQINELSAKVSECASAQQVNALSLQVQDLTKAMTALLQLQMPIITQNNTQPTMPPATGGGSQYDVSTPDHLEQTKSKRSLIHAFTHRDTDSQRQPPTSESIPADSLKITCPTDSTQRTETPSPEKKKTKIYSNPSPAIYDHAQESSAQYTRDCTPDGPEL